MLYLPLLTRLDSLLQTEGELPVRQITPHSLYDILHLQNSIKRQSQLWLSFRDRSGRPLFQRFFLMTGLLQKLKCQLRDVLPCLLDVMWLSSACTDGKAQDKAAWELTRHQMDLSALGDPFQQLLVQFIGALRGESKEELHQLGFVSWLLNN